MGIGNTIENIWKKHKKILFHFFIAISLTMIICFFYRYLTAISLEKYGMTFWGGLVAIVIAFASIPPLMASFISSYDSVNFRNTLAYILEATHYIWKLIIAFAILIISFTLVTVNIHNKYLDLLVKITFLYFICLLLFWFISLLKDMFDYICKMQADQRRERFDYYLKQFRSYLDKDIENGQKIIEEVCGRGILFKPSRLYLSDSNFYIDYPYEDSIFTGIDWGIFDKVKARIFEEYKIFLVCAPNTYVKSGKTILLLERISKDKVKNRPEQNNQQADNDPKEDADYRKAIEENRDENKKREKLSEENIKKQLRGSFKMKPSSEQIEKGRKLYSLINETIERCQQYILEEKDLYFESELKTFIDFLKKWQKEGFEIYNISDLYENRLFTTRESILAELLDPIITNLVKTENRENCRVFASFIYDLMNIATQEQDENG